MYHYQLMLAKDWESKQQKRKNEMFAFGVFDRYWSQPKQIKYFYDSDYRDIVQQLVNDPDSCQDFYAVLQQVGLPYQTYYHRIPDKVTTVCQSALADNRIVLLRRVDYGGYFSDVNVSNHPSTRQYTQKTKFIPEPAYEPNHSWITVYITNFKQLPFFIYDCYSYNKCIGESTTSEDKIVLQSEKVLKSEALLPKVDLYLGGLNYRVNVAFRGREPLRVKKLAQSWVDNLTQLLKSGNSPFTIEQDQALVSQINSNIRNDRSAIISINKGDGFRPDEAIGAFFWAMLDLLKNTYFFMPQQKMGDCSIQQSEGAIPDLKLYNRAEALLGAIRMSEGYEKSNYAYNNDKLNKLASYYLFEPLVLDQRSPDELSRNNEEDLIKQVHESLTIDRLEDIIELFIDAVKILKHLIVPGLFKEVQTRQKYTLKVTKLDYQYIELPEQKGFYIDSHKDLKYEISAPNQPYLLVGRFNKKGKADIKIPAKWSHIDNWQITTTPIELTFIEEFFRDVIKPTYNKYENQIDGGLKVLNGVMTMVFAGTIEVGTGGLATAVSVSMGVIAIDNIATGVAQIAQDKPMLTYGAQVIKWTGLAPEGYEEMIYGFVDLSLSSKAYMISKSVPSTVKIVMMAKSTDAPNILKNARIVIDNFMPNSMKNRHRIGYKAVSEKQLSRAELTKYYDDVLLTLTENERIALHIYSGDDYIKINNYLRGISDDLNGVSPTVVNDLKSALNKAIVPQNMVVYRGTDVKPFKQFLILNDTSGNYEWNHLSGKIIRDSGFVSTSIEKSKAFLELGVIWEINIPKGAKGVMLNQLSQYPSEAELLLNAGHEFLITGVKTGESGNVTVIMNLIIE